MAPCAACDACAWNAWHRAANDFTGAASSRCVCPGTPSLLLYVVPRASDSALSACMRWWCSAATAALHVSLSSSRRHVVFGVYYPLLRRCGVAAGPIALAQPLATLRTTFILSRAVAAHAAVAPGPL